MFAPFPCRTDFDPVEFELEAIKLIAPTLLNVGYLELRGSRGESRQIRFSELLGSLMAWNVDADATSVKVLITGFAVVCGEYESDISRSYSVTINGPEEKLELLKKSLLREQGFTVVG